MLAGYFDDVGTRVDTALAGITGALHGISSVAKLPLINAKLEDLDQLTNSLDTFRVQLKNRLATLDPVNGALPVKTAIFDVLGPGGANVLGDRVAPAGIDVEDVSVTNVSASSIDISLDLGLEISFNRSVGLGIDSIPLRPVGNDSEGGFTIRLEYENFNFGYRNGSAYFDTSAANELKFEIDGNLPSDLAVGLGFLMFTVEDKHAGPDITLTFSADITPSFAITNPAIGGEVHLHLGLTAEALEGLPQFRALMKLDWEMPTGGVSPGAALGSSWGSPTLRFDDVSINVGSLLGGLVQPLAERAQTLLEPMQPVFDLLTQPLPVLDDLSALAGGPVIDLVFMSQALSASPVPLPLPNDFVNVIQAVDRLRHYSATIDALAGLSGNSWVEIGDFNILGEPGKGLLDTAAALGNLADSKLSKLGFSMLSGGVPDINAFKNAIVDAIPGPLGKEVKGILEALASQTDGNGIKIEFPILDDPGGKAMAFFLGQNTDLINVKANLKLDIDRRFDLSPIPGLIIGLDGAGSFTAFAQIGYDTTGVRKAIEGLYDSNPNTSFAPGRALDGLWIDRNTRLEGGASIAIVGGVGLTDVVEFVARGGLTSNVTISLSNPNNKDRLRPTEGDLGDRLFDAIGTVDAFAEVKFKVGFEVLGEWIGFEKSWPFANANIFTFDTASVPVPNNMRPTPPTNTPPQLARYDAATRTLTLNVGNDAYLRGAAFAGIKNENFTIKRVTSKAVTGSGGVFDPAGIVNGPLIVSAFGYSQVFTGEIDTVIATMDDGNDRLRIVDLLGSADYYIDAGDDDDVVNVDGNVNVNIQGGFGDDKLDGGSGKDYITIDGGFGINTITIGDGLLKNVNPAAVINVNGGAGSTLVLDNTDDYSGSIYTFYDDINANSWIVSVTSKVPGSATRSIATPRMKMKVMAGDGNDTFRGWFPSRSQIYANGGDDDLDLTYQQPGILPHFSIANPMEFYGGAGFDRVPLSDLNAPVSSPGVKVYANKFSGPSSVIEWGNSATPTTLGIHSIEDTSIRLQQTSTISIQSWGDQKLTVEGQEVDLYTSYVVKDASVQIENTPNIAVIEFPSVPNHTGMGIDKDGPYIGRPLSYSSYDPQTRVPMVAKTRFDYDQVTTSVQFFGSLMFIEPNVMHSQRNWNFSFAGNFGQNNVLHITPPDPTDAGAPPVDYLYEITNNTLSIGPLTINATNLSEYWLSGGTGSDTVIIDSLPSGVLARIDGGYGDDQVMFGGGNLGFAPAWLLDGGPGDDILTLDDSQRTANATWEIKPDEIEFFGGVFSIGTEGFEEINLLSGSGNDNLSFTGVHTRHVHLEAGGGNDTITTGYNGATEFRGQVEIFGEAGNDTFDFYAMNNRLYGNLESMTLDGGTGTNSLRIDEFERYPNSMLYEIYADRFKSTQFGFSGVMAEFNYSRMSLPTLSTSSGSNLIQVYGTASDIDGAFRIQGNNGSNLVIVHPIDSQGNSTINGRLAFEGGTGTDRLIVDRANETQGVTYNIGNLFGSTNLLIGNSANIGANSAVDQVEVQAGSGSDLFKIDYFESTATALTLLAGNGDDSLALASISGNLFNAIARGAQFSFDGGDGFDAFSVNNSLNNEAGTYTRDGGVLSILRGGTSSPYTYSPTNFESMEITAGSGADRFLLEALPVGQSLAYFGGSGVDTSLIAPTRRNAKEIRGTVRIDGGADGGSLTVFDVSSTTGSVIHINPDGDGTIAAWPGDSLWGVGGSLVAQNLADDATGTGLRFELGSGADTIYTQTSTTATLHITANEPNAAPGDRLLMDILDGADPFLLSFGGGVGSATFSNRKSILWIGIEEVTSNYSLPERFVVTNTLDSGPGSLRQAILDVNAVPTETAPDVIRFAIPGTGPHSIKLLSPLPYISDRVILDATTQPGYAGKPVVELDGSLAGRSNGLVILSGGTTVRGLAINRFAELSSIVLLSAGDNVIQSNYLGTNLAGNAVHPIAPQTVWGVVVYGSDNNVIGTDGDGVNDALEGNVLSGFGGAGILFQEGLPGELPDNNVIAGNRIGTSADGNTALGNGRMGIFVMASGTGNRIGTNSDGISDTAERNLVSGNPEAGIYLGGSGFVVAGNYIGTNAAGTAALPNGNGVRIELASNNLVGGTAGNRIAFNTYSGVSIGPGNGNSVLSNSIFANGEIGIDLNMFGDTANRVTPNDSSDDDSGPNELQNSPVINSAITTGFSSIVGGSLQSTANTTFRIEFFISGARDPSGYGEGQVYLGFIPLTTDDGGHANFITEFSGIIPSPGEFITATATDPHGNTSEFSNGVALVQNGAQHAIALPHPTSTGYVIVTSASGTDIDASITTTPGVTPPSGLQFPFGFLDFTVSGLAPGAASDVVIEGLDVSQITDYFKYGPTPANGEAHWYDFLFGVPTDSDSAVGTGMEIVDGNIVLHLIDGGRGDDDLVANGIISDIGGPVTNRPPVAGNDNVVTQRNTAVVINVLSNDSDPGGALNPATVAIATAPGHGTASVNATTGLITYTPTSNYTGPDSFTYQVRDNQGALSNLATVAITVNVPPTAVNDSVTTNKNTAALISVLSNDFDLDGILDPATVTILAAANRGTTSINPTTGVITYTPAANYNGADSFTYKFKDNTGAYSNVATVSINVNVPPQAVSDTVTTYKNKSVVINVLANDSDFDGTVNPATVAIVGAATHGTTSIHPTTGAITYTPNTNYTGPDSLTYKVKDNSGADSNVVTVSITVSATGSITGKEYLDITGNGLTADDTPLANVKVYLDTNNNGTWNFGEPSTTTLPDGGYAFADLVADTYRVRQVTPSGYVRTSPSTSDLFNVVLGIGQNSSGNHFANAELGNLAVLSNVVYLVNGTTPVSDLRGNTREGDTIQVSFTIAAGATPQRFTLVSYTAPVSAWDPSTAAQQKIFDTDTGVFGPGTHALTVSNPHSYFQVDFVSGYAIDRLGPAGSNIFYSNQNRLASADNGGSRAVLASPAALSGTVYRDANNNGTIDAGELPLAGVKVTVSGGSTKQTAVTDMYGVYTFDNLPAGTYTITETQPKDYTDGKETLGNKGGTVGSDKFTGIVLSANAVGSGYNFGEQQTVGAAVAGNQTQSLAWWNGSNGQALIKALNGGQNAKNLGNWLASTYNSLFGADALSANNMAGKTNAQVAAYYQSLYNNATRKPEAEALALALAVYVTNSGLAGTTATSYGFAVSAAGLGTATVNVGSNGAAFGVKNNVVLTITELLSRTNSRARKGLVWDGNGDGTLSPAETILRNQVYSVFGAVNNA